MRSAHFSALLLSAIAHISACASDQRTLNPIAVTQEPAFIPFKKTAGDTPLTDEEWQQFFDEVRAKPGAQVVGEEGPLLVMINVQSSNEHSAYIFTQPALPAHPAYLKAFSNDPSGRPVTVVGSYAGSKAEFDKFARTFMEAMQSDSR